MFAQLFSYSCGGDVSKWRGGEEGWGEGGSEPSGLEVEIC